MKNHSIQLVLFSVFLFFLYGCSSSGSVGSWDYTVKTAGGDLYGVMTIEKEGSQYMGYLLPNLSDTLKLENVHVKDNQLSSDFNFRSALYNLTGTFTGNIFTGEVLIGSDKFTVNGTRVNAIVKSTALKTKSKIKFIYDGDIGPDPCDFSTISMLHEYHNKGFIELLAVIGETPDPYLASTFSIYNQIYGNEIPIAAYNAVSSDVDFENDVIKKYYEAIKRDCHTDENKTIYEKYGNEKTLRSNDVTGTVTLYRKILSEAEDNSIVIYAAGQLYNFPPLLKSGADQYSRLSGKELLKAKLRKIVLMGGYFPESKVNPWYIQNTDGAEWNWWAFGSKNTTKITINALVEMGKPIIYIGAEVGWQVRVGMEMAERLGREHPTTEAFYLFKNTTKPTNNTIDEDPVLTSENPAYDEIGLFVAVEGGIGEFFNTIQGRVEIDEHGANSWISDKEGKESYITLLPGVTKKLSMVITDRITGDF